MNKLKPIGELWRGAARLPRVILGNALAGFESLIQSYAALWPQTRVSHPLSKLLRPAFEHRRIKAIIGANLVGAMVLVGSVSTPLGAEETFPEAETAVLTETPVLTTTERFSLPLSTIDLSQRFSSVHPGIDLRAPLGTAVTPVAPGVVSEANRGRFGYGNYVLVDHEDGFVSLYAHLAQINVSPQERVEQTTVIGGVGKTGWATGSHLHLELYQNGQPLNPLTVLPR